MQKISPKELMALASEQLAGMQAPGYIMTDEELVRLTKQARKCAFALAVAFGFELEAAPSGYAESTPAKPTTGDWVKYRGREGIKHPGLTKGKAYQLIGTRDTASGQHRLRLINDAGYPNYYGAHLFEWAEVTPREAMRPVKPICPTDAPSSDLGQFT